MARKPWLRFLLGFILLALLAYTGWRHIDLSRLRRLILNASGAGIMSLAMIYLVTRMFNGEVLRLSARALGVDMSQSEGFMMIMIMSYTNLLIPRAGMGAPAVYLKYKHGLRFSEFTSFFLLGSIVQLACIGLVGLLAQVSVYYGHNLAINKGLAAFFGALMLGCVILLSLPLKIPEGWGGRLFETLRAFSNAWHKLRLNRPIMVKLILVQIIVITLWAVRLQVAYYSLGRPVPFSGALIVALLGQLGMFISLTPGSVGFREAGIIYASYLIGDAAGTGTAVAILDRFVMTACIIVAGQLCLWFGLKMKKPPAQGEPTQS